MDTEVIAPGTAPLFDTYTSRRAFSLYVALAGAIILLIGMPSSVYTLISNDPKIKPLSHDGSALPLYVVLTLFAAILYFFVIGNKFGRLTMLLMISVVISTFALISSQTQVNT